MNPARRLRHIAEYAGFRLLGAIIGAIPLELASRWSGAGWRRIAPRLRRHQRALANLAQAFPEKTPAERERIALGMWDNLGRTFAEFFHLSQIIAEDRLRFEQPGEVAALRARGALVVCAPHLGNWEILGAAARVVGLAPAGVYQALTNPLVDRYISALRAPLYPGGLMAKSPRAAKAMLRYARSGGCVSFLADQREGRGVAAPFFGRPAPSTPFPALIARAADAPLIAARVMRLEGVRFALAIEEIAVPRTADRDADVAAATCALQAAFEAMIRKAPEQWMWAHRRWD